MKLSVLIPVAFFAAVPLIAYGHEGHHPKEGEIEKVNTVDPRIVAIGHNYEQKVRPLFKKSCFDGHSDKTRWPSYYGYPIAKQLIDRDISEAREHLDFSGGYPFKSHASPVEDMDAIIEEVSEGDMPPWRYWIFHREARLNRDEKKVILDWARESKNLLQGATQK